MIPLMKHAFLHEQETKQALAQFILTAPKLSMDIKCVEFEKAFAKYQGSKHAVLFNSGGSANLAVLQALRNLGRLKEGSQVGFSALTWSTNVFPIIQMGMKAIPVDCDPKTLNVMSDTLQKRIKEEHVDALFITNALGFAGDLDKIRSLCAKHNIILLEDNCESLGTELRTGGKTGSFGLAATFSFFVAHHMSTIEGGMAVTDDDDLSQMLRLVRANGWDRNLTAQQQFALRKKYHVDSEFNAKYIFYDLGFNMRPTEITGFLGLNQLQFLHDNLQKRQHYYLILEKELKKNDELVVLDRSHIAFLSSFSFPVVCKTPQLREKYLSQFSGAGVEVRPVIAGDIQKQPFYKKYVKKIYDLPGAEFLDRCGFYCGNYPELTESDMETLKSCIKKY